MGEQEIALGRAGHYFTPTSSEGDELAGSCQQATVAGYDGPDDTRTHVNLSVLTHTAVQDPRLGVDVTPPAQGAASFHLNRDCPWGR